MDILFTLDLLFIVLTFFCQSHPLLEFHSTFSEYFLLLLGSLLHANEDGDQVQHNPEHHGNNLHTEEGRLNPEVNPEHHNNHLQGGEGEDQVQLPQKKHVDHLHAEESEYQVQSRTS